jgi:hypothetical protein
LYQVANIRFNLDMLSKLLIYIIKIIFIKILI